MSELAVVIYLAALLNMHACSASILRLDNDFWAQNDTIPAFRSCSLIHHPVQYIISFFIKQCKLGSWFDGSQVLWSQTPYPNVGILESCKNWEVSMEQNLDTGQNHRLLPGDFYTLGSRSGKISEIQDSSLRMPERQTVNTSQQVSTRKESGQHKLDQCWNC